MDYLAAAKKIEKTIVKDLSSWIQVGSVFDETTIAPQMPFGKGVHDALKWIANKARKDGFQVEECDGYCVEITAGEGPELVMILGHADVVPTGTGWQDDPFSGLVKDGRIFGRGTQDDKGPTLAAYHAMKLIKDSGKKLPRRLRLVVGGNEERGSACMEYYFDTLKKEAPTYGFTPDASFPLIYGEKGIMNYTYEGSLKDSILSFFDGGIVSNSVPEEASAIIQGKKELIPLFDKFMKEHQLIGKSDLQSDGLHLYVKGRAAHGSRPSDGINAATYLLDFIGQNTESPLAKHFGKILNDYTGKTLGINYQSTTMGELTVNVGILHFEKGTYKIILNIRYPNTLTGEEVSRGLTHHRLHKSRVLMDSKPLYIDPSSPLIQTLWKSYREVTGDNETKPFTIGGGTYARHTTNTVAFGMAFPNKSIDLMHQRDESLPIDELTLGTAVYLHALTSLVFGHENT